MHSGGKTHCGSTGGAGISGYAYTAAPAADRYSILALRTRGVRYWFAAFGLLGFLVLYVAPMVNAFRAPVSVEPLPSLIAPRVWFPPLSVPKLRAPGALPKLPAAPA